MRRTGSRRGHDTSSHAAERAIVASSTADRPTTPVTRSAPILTTQPRLVADQTVDVAELVVLVLRRGAEPASLDVHVHALRGGTLGHELQEDLKEHGVDGGLMAFANDVTHTVVTIASALGGAAGVAAALKVFLERHRHKKVSVEANDLPGPRRFE